LALLDQAEYWMTVLGHVAPSSDARRWKTMEDDGRLSLKNPAQQLTHQSSPEGSACRLLGGSLFALCCKRLFHAIKGLEFPLHDHISVDLVFPGDFSHRAIASNRSQCHFAFELC
jgi:hypothetical protein